jgi:hypothetical protein
MNRIAMSHPQRFEIRRDAYLRRLLVLGARAVLRHLKAKPDQEPGWIDRLIGRRRSNSAAGALANNCTVRTHHSRDR